MDPAERDPEAFGARERLRELGTDWRVYQLLLVDTLREVIAAQEARDAALDQAWAAELRRWRREGSADAAPGAECDRMAEGER
jgi:hypothetical protein